MAFRGTFDYSLDQKGRLTVPAKYRAQLGESAVLVAATDGCIEVWRPEEFDGRFQAALAGVNPLSAQAREIRMHFFGNSHEVDLDSAGRVAIPSGMQVHASLTKVVQVVGAGDHFQVWSREGWTGRRGELGGKIDDLIENLGHPA
jgi:MraZ protein